MVYTAKICDATYRQNCPKILSAILVFQHETVKAGCIVVHRNKTSVTNKAPFTRAIFMWQLLFARVDGSTNICC